MSQILVIFIFCLLNFAIGWGFGTEHGREQVHTGNYACMTLPDKTIHCWKAETK